MAIIVKSIDNVNVGKIVQVRQWMGEHSKLGHIWHVRSRGNDLITEYGAVGPECDCADDWLRPLPPEALEAANEVHYEEPLKEAA